MKDMLIIGIAGGSGSGKSTLTQRIVSQFGESVTVIRHDDYYKAHDEMSFDERKNLNYDHPNAFDTDLMLEHIQMLKAGNEIHCPIYDYTVHNRSRNYQVIRPNRVILIEGILIFENRALCSEMDIKIFVDTDPDIRLIRRIQRDVIERARDLNGVIHQYMDTVKPMHEQFVEPSKKNADIIVLEGGHNQVAMEMIQDRISRHLHTVSDESGTEIGRTESIKKS